MPRLSCSACECGHNSEGYCCLDAVNVSGGVSKENTCCASFTINSGASNCCSTPSAQTAVTCRANDCVHNENCTCHADSVSICTCGSGCTCKDTECDTFKKK